MSTYSEKRMWEIIDAFNGVEEALDKLESTIAAVDVNEYKPAGQDFIKDMAFCHRRMLETHIIYRSDVREAEAVLGPRLETYALRPGLETCGASR